MKSTSEEKKTSGVLPNSEYLRLRDQRNLAVGYIAQTDCMPSKVREITFQKHKQVRRPYHRNYQDCKKQLAGNSAWLQHNAVQHLEIIFLPLLSQGQFWPKVPVEFSHFFQSRALGYLRQLLYSFPGSTCSGDPCFTVTVQPSLWWHSSKQSSLVSPLSSRQRSEMVSHAVAPHRGLPCCKQLLLILVCYD